MLNDKSIETQITGTKTQITSNQHTESSATYLLRVSIAGLGVKTGSGRVKTGCRGRVKTGCRGRIKTGWSRVALLKTYHISAYRRPHIYNSLCFNSLMWDEHTLFSILNDSNEQNYITQKFKIDEIIDSAKAHCINNCNLSFKSVKKTCL